MVNENGERPVVKLWLADPVLAALLLRFTRCHWEVSDFDEIESPGPLSARPALLLCGPDLLCEAEKVRLLHHMHRSRSAIIMIVGRVSAAEELVARELGAVAIVSGLRHAITAARALQSYLGTKTE